MNINCLTENSKKKKSVKIIKNITYQKKNEK